GTPLHSCSKEFQQVFNETNIVLAKGQANYETLESEVTPGSPFAGKPIYFLLTVKCDVVSEVLGLPLGTPVLVKEL
ncbi:MAG: ARMT1-like domain-containing protein, partial [Planctomycetota bacterium]|nr:ARMT1-like domain-containing protein [Planctomycetota bacterium]